MNMEVQEKVDTVWPGRRGAHPSILLPRWEQVIRQLVLTYRAKSSECSRLSFIFEDLQIQYSILRVDFYIGCPQRGFSRHGSECGCTLNERISGMLEDKPINILTYETRELRCCSWTWLGRF